MLRWRLRLPLRYQSHKTAGEFGHNRTAPGRILNFLSSWFRGAGQAIAGPTGNGCYGMNIGAIISTVMRISTHVDCDPCCW